MQIEIIIQDVPRDDTRIQNVQDDWAEWSADHKEEIVTGAHFLVVHPDLQYRSIDTWLEVADAGGGVCFISGGPGGVKEALTEKLESKSRSWPERWRVLTDAVSTNAPHGLRRRFSSLLQSVARKAPGDEIPWTMLYPSETFENLVAFYLWCLAAPSLSKIKNGEIPPQIYDVAALAADEFDRAQVADEKKAELRMWTPYGEELDSDACQEVVRILRPVVSTRTA